MYVNHAFNMCGFNLHREKWVYRTTDPHVFYNRLPLLFLIDVYGNQDEMGGEVSEIWKWI